MCSRSAVNTGRPPIKRRNTDRVVSRIGRPKETIGIAIAITVGAFSEPASAKALSINPMNKLPQSPRKMVAGLKLNRRNPRMAPARAIVSSDMDDEPLEIATTKTTEVENNAHPGGGQANRTSGAPHPLHVQWDPVYRANQTRGPRGSRYVRVLWGHRLLHGDRGRLLLEDPEYALERHDYHQDVRHWGSWLD